MGQKSLGKNSFLVLRSIFFLKLAGLLLAVVKSEGTCEKSGNYGCGGGTLTNQNYLHSKGGQTTETCKSKCLQHPECQNFVLVDQGGYCYLFRGECNKYSQIAAEYYECSKGDPDPCDSKGCDDGAQIRMAPLFVIAAPRLFSFWTMMENHAFKNAPLTMAVVMRLPSAPTLRKPGKILCAPVPLGSSSPLMDALAQALQTPLNIAQPPLAGPTKRSRERKNVL